MSMAMYYYGKHPSLVRNINTWALTCLIMYVWSNCSVNNVSSVVAAAVTAAWQFHVRNTWSTSSLSLDLALSCSLALCRLYDVWRDRWGDSFSPPDLNATVSLMEQYLILEIPFQLYRERKKRKLEVIISLIESPRNYETSREKRPYQFLLVKNKYIINDTRHGWDKLKNVYKYENRDCPKFSLASQI